MGGFRDFSNIESIESRQRRRDALRNQNGSWTMDDLRAHGGEKHNRLLQRLAANMEGTSEYHISDIEAINFDAFAYTALLMAHGCFRRDQLECNIRRSQHTGDDENNGDHEIPMTDEEIIERTIALFRQFSTYTLASLQATKICAEDHVAMQCNSFLKDDVEKDELIKTIISFRQAYNKHPLSTIGAMQLHAKDHNVRIVHCHLNGFLLENCNLMGMLRTWNNEWQPTPSDVRLRNMKSLYFE